MAIKKHIVHVSYHTCVDVTILADESVSQDEILELGREKAAINEKAIEDEILGNLVEDGNTEILESGLDPFETKDDAYNALQDCIDGGGGYEVFQKKDRPTYTITEDGKNIEVTIKSLVVIGSDDSSPLRFIDEDDAMWDVDDYLGKDEITELYGIIQCWNLM